ncbi:hypothetical protein BJ138DRAFT_1182779 [Hygrophoropsis aurantiaca]|uniref:Uncharacterized protein n=1 Tax=Hygrophoropsis aurantiaca TaxID=72124 RepID=A0ACB8A0L0_9AGAM|nr:hypothetical protein BJ138DRAFT_1182779 [Hygrophoropsis aurantiaca]
MLAAPLEPAVYSTLQDLSYVLGLAPRSQLPTVIRAPSTSLRYRELLTTNPRTNVSQSNIAAKSLQHPGVVVIRTDDDDGDNSGYPSASSNPASNFIAPYVVNVLSSVPVNAAAIRQNYLITPSDAHVFEDGIRNTMRDRMARALRIFEVRGNKAIVLGAFGCGSSENRIEMVAELWAELLVCEERSAEGDDPTIGINSVKQPAKFKDVFEEVVFAVPGKLHEPFKKAFEMRVFEAVVSGAATFSNGSNTVCNSYV